MNSRHKRPVFLIKNFVYLIVFSIVLGYLFFFIKPIHFTLVGIFLFVLLGFLVHLVSTTWFLITFAGQKRVWYLKTDEFRGIYKKSLYFSIFLILLLFLKYISLLNYWAVGILILTVGFVYLGDVRRSR